MNEHGTTLEQGDTVGGLPSLSLVGFHHSHERLCVIRLSLGKLLVNLLQVVKRTNTPLLIIP